MDDATAAVPRLDDYGDPVPARPATRDTYVLDPAAAGAIADPVAYTQALPRPDPDHGGPAASTVRTLAPSPVVGRHVAAELGVYAGAALVGVALVMAAASGWADWSDSMRQSTIGLAALALLATGLFVRLPWRRKMGAARRRAVSAMLTAGVLVLLTGGALALGLGEQRAASAVLPFALVAAVAVGLVNVIARTPLSEVALLVAVVASLWWAAPPGHPYWLVLAGVGLLWAALGVRWARGRRTAVVLGMALALLSAVGLAQATWAWPVRVALLGLAGLGLVQFLRGGPNAWLALGVGAATALAGAVAGGSLSPALALLVAGVTTMAVSALALRGVGRADGPEPLPSPGDAPVG